MYKNMSISRKMKSYFKNPTLIPLFMYDSSFEYLEPRYFKSKNHSKKSLDIMYELTMTFTDYDLIDTKKKKEVFYDLEKYSCVLSSIKPYEIIKPIRKKENEKLEFPAYLRKINKKSNDLKFKFNKTDMTEIEEYYYKHDKKFIYLI